MSRSLHYRKRSAGSNPPLGSLTQAAPPGMHRVMAAERCFCGRLAIPLPRFKLPAQSMYPRRLRREPYDPLLLERFRAKWVPVRVKKTRQNKKLEPRSDSIGTEKALGLHLFASCKMHPDLQNRCGAR